MVTCLRVPTAACSYKGAESSRLRVVCSAYRVPSLALPRSVRPPRVPPPAPRKLAGSSLCTASAGTSGPLHLESERVSFQTLSPSHERNACLWQETAQVQKHVKE